METKVCGKCQEEKKTEEFYKDLDKSDGLCSSCKLCKNKQNKEYRSRPEFKEERKIRESDPKYSNQKKEWGKKKYQTEEYKEKNRERCKNSEYKEKRKQYLKEYKTSNMYIETRKKYKESGKLREAQRKSREKRQKDPKRRLDHSIGTAIWKALKSDKAGRSWETILGYTLNELIVHLEKQFTEEMTWENYGSYWHIDHIKPRSWFTYQSPEDSDFKECWSLTNLKPLSAEENRLKSNKFEG
jgi:hypothetical protein